MRYYFDKIWDSISTEGGVAAIVFLFMMVFLPSMLMIKSCTATSPQEIRLEQEKLNLEREKAGLSRIEFNK